jgi:6,7-dimethyl-8-ribityllumazine synthase
MGRSSEGAAVPARACSRVWRPGILDILLEPVFAVVAASAAAVAWARAFLRPSEGWLTETEPLLVRELAISASSESTLDCMDFCIFSMASPISAGAAGFSLGIRLLRSMGLGSTFISPVCGFSAVNATASGTFGASSGILAGAESARVFGSIFAWRMTTFGGASWSFSLVEKPSRTVVRIQTMADPWMRRETARPIHIQVAIWREWDASRFSEKVAMGWMMAGSMEFHKGRGGRCFPLELARLEWTENSSNLVSHLLPERPLEPLNLPEASGFRVAVVASIYNPQWVDALVRHFLEEIALIVPGVVPEVFRVPGSYEIPIAVQSVLERRKPHVVATFGVILAGETSHADLISTAVTRALMDLSLEHRVPVLHEVLCVENERQAEERCLHPELNRGVEAARAACRVVSIMREIAG